MGQPHPGITKVIIMLTAAVCALFLLTTAAVMWGALYSTRTLGDAETGLLLVLGTGIIGLVSAGLGAYFGLESEQAQWPDDSDIETDPPDPEFALSKEDE